MSAAVNKSKKSKKSKKTDNARQAALSIVTRLRDAGHVAYFAGGCVRDQLLGAAPKDYDVATDARPEQVRKLFKQARLVGESFGVSLVGQLGYDTEVAAFRTEWGYTDGRHPSHVEFTDAEHDAQRRDFTINGLFYDPIAKEVIDYIGGRIDLKRQLIRAIGEPSQRFDEDYLRLLRAVRFAARLSFTIEDKTAEAIIEHAPKLSQISRERIGQELRAMLTGPRKATAVRLLQRLQLDAPTLMETTIVAPAPTVAGLRQGAAFATVLIAWMVDRHVSAKYAAPIKAAVLETFTRESADKLVRRWRKALCLSNEETDELRALIKHLPTALNWPKLSLAHRKRLLAQPSWRQLHLLLRALRKRYDLAPLILELEKDAEALLAQGVAPTPWINGDDLIAMGRKPGPAFGRLLEQAYDQQLEGRWVDRQAALAWLRRQPLSD